MPTGSPVAAAMDSTKSSSASAVPKALCAAGLAQSRSRGDAARLRNLRADLRLRQQAAGTRLGALTQFDLDRANLRTPRDGLLQPRQAEAAVGLTAAEVAGADLPDQVPPR